MLLRRAHAVQAGHPRLPGDRQRRLPEPAHRRLQRLRRGREPVPPGQPRRSHAALDAVPDRLQPRLRALEHERDGRSEHDRERGQDQRPAGQLPLRPADLPRRPERARRPGPARASGQPDQPGRRRRRQPAPARLHAARHGRRAAGPAVPGDQARDHAQRADPERHRVQGHGLLHRPPRRAHRRRRLHRGLVSQQQPGRRRLVRDHRAARDDGLDAAQQPPDGQADLRLL